MAALAIKSLLNRLSLEVQNSMFTLVNTWLTDEKVSRETKGWKSLLKCVLDLTVWVWASVDGPATTRSSGLWAVCRSWRSKIQPETESPDTSHRERNTRFQLWGREYRVSLFVDLFCICLSLFALIMAVIWLIRLRKRRRRRLQTDCSSVTSRSSSNSSKTVAFWSSTHLQTCLTASGVWTHAAKSSQC